LRLSRRRATGAVRTRQLCRVHLGTAPLKTLALSCVAPNYRAHPLPQRQATDPNPKTHETPPRRRTALWLAQLPRCVLQKHIHHLLPRDAARAAARAHAMHGGSPLAGAPPPARLCPYPAQPYSPRSREHAAPEAIEAQAPGGASTAGRGRVGRDGAAPAQRVSRIRRRARAGRTRCEPAAPPCSGRAPRRRSAYKPRAPLRRSALGWHGDGRPHGDDGTGQSSRQASWFHHGTFGRIYGDPGRIARLDPECAPRSTDG
jgi:hypothetical protein